MLFSTIAQVQKAVYYNINIYVYVVVNNTIITQELDWSFDVALVNGKQNIWEELADGDGK